MDRRAEQRQHIRRANVRGTLELIGVFGSFYDTRRQVDQRLGQSVDRLAHVDGRTTRSIPGDRDRRGVEVAVRSGEGLAKLRGQFPAPLLERLLGGRGKQSVQHQGGVPGRVGPWVAEWDLVVDMATRDDAFVTPFDVEAHVEEIHVVDGEELGVGVRVGKHGLRNEIADVELVVLAESRGDVLNR